MQVHALKKRIKAQLEAAEAETARLLDALFALEQIPDLAAEYGIFAQSPVEEIEGDQIPAQELTPVNKQESEPYVLSSTKPINAEPTAMDLLRSKLAKENTTSEKHFRFSLFS